MKIYNKLVRDKIKDIMIKNGADPVTKVLTEEECLIELDKKLLEEVNEYLTDGNVEELADIEEVLRAILDIKKVSYTEFEEIRKEKVIKRGAFKKRIFLEREN